MKTRHALIPGLAFALVMPLAMARSIPDPHQTHAPGNESPQTPISQEHFSNAVNYQLQCGGCHLQDGSGSKSNDVPRMKGFLGNFLKVDGGREFVLRVPGMSQSALNNAQIADMINWLMRKDGMAGDSMPENFKPYTEAEVASVRHKIMFNLPGTRATLISEMRKQGIDVAADGMSH